MNKKRAIFLILGLIIWGFLGFAWMKYGGLIKLVLIKPSVTITDGVLKAPDGFKISVFAEGLPGARVIAPDTFGNLWVSQMSEGVVSLLEIDKGLGKVSNVSPIFTGLNRPHGLAFHPKFPFRLYIAEEDKIISVPTYSEPDTIKIVDLPSGGNHKSRTIGFGPDGRFYASIGSTCNVCHETDDRRAAILVGDGDGGNLKVLAKGLRNSVFFTWLGDKLFATDMGRDYLGDDLPPDEINIVREGNYGWPICYGKNIHDEDFDKNVYFRNPCMEPFETPSYIDIPAHSAPLGLAFIPSGSAWPKDYWNDLLVAYHGSWNRSVPTGYKVVRFKFNIQGEYEGQVDDFITGFIKDGNVIGRPVDIKVSPDGYAYISDDYAGVIYKISNIKN